MDVARTNTGYILYLVIVISRWGENFVTVYNPFHDFINMGNEQYFENISEVWMHFTSSTNRRSYSVFLESLQSSPITMKYLPD